MRERGGNEKPEGEGKTRKYAKGGEMKSARRGENETGGARCAKHAITRGEER